jgi:hypothetical protein
MGKSSGVFGDVLSTTGPDRELRLMCPLCL